MYRESWADEVISRLRYMSLRGSLHLHISMTSECESILYCLITKCKLKDVQHTRKQKIFYNRGDFNFLGIIKQIFLDSEIPSSWIKNILTASLPSVFEREREYGKTTLELISLKDSDNFDEEYLMWRMCS